MTFASQDPDSDPATSHPLVSYEMDSKILDY